MKLRKYYFGCHVFLTPAITWCSPDNKMLFVVVYSNLLYIRISGRPIRLHHVSVVIHYYLCRWTRGNAFKAYSGCKSNLKMLLYEGLWVALNIPEPRRCRYTLELRAKKKKTTCVQQLNSIKTSISNPTTPNETMTSRIYRPRRSSSTTNETDGNY